MSAEVVALAARLASADELGPGEVRERLAEAMRLGVKMKHEAPRDTDDMVKRLAPPILAAMCKHPTDGHILRLGTMVLIHLQGDPGSWPDDKHQAFLAAYDVSLHGEILEDLPEDLRPTLGVPGKNKYVEMHAGMMLISLCSLDGAKAFVEAGGMPKIASHILSGDDEDAISTRWDDDGATDTSRNVALDLLDSVLRLRPETRPEALKNGVLSAVMAALKWYGLDRDNEAEIPETCCKVLCTLCEDDACKEAVIQALKGPYSFANITNRDSKGIPGSPTYRIRVLAGFDEE